MLVPHLLQMDKKKLPVFVEFPPHFNPAALTYHHDGPGACARGQYFCHNKVDKAKKVSLLVICLL